MLRFVESCRLAEMSCSSRMPRQCPLSESVNNAVAVSQRMYTSTQGRTAVTSDMVGSRDEGRRWEGRKEASVRLRAQAVLATFFNFASKDSHA